MCFLYRAFKQEDSKGEKRGDGEASPTCCSQPSSSHLKPNNTPSHIAVQTTPPILRQSIVKLKSSSRDLMAHSTAKTPYQSSNYHENGWEPTITTHTHAHTPGRTTTWETLKPGAGLHMVAADTELCVPVLLKLHYPINKLHFPKLTLQNPVILV